MASRHRHQCLLYSGSPADQLPALAAMTKKKLEQGYRCLYLNNPSMMAGLRSRLSALGVDVEKEVAMKHLILSSDSPVEEDGDFDADLMLAQLEHMLDEAINDGFKGLWASGDMTWEFGPDKNFVKLMDYEARLEMMFHRRPELCGVCQYHKDSVPIDSAREALLSHESVFINETLALANPLFIPVGSLGETRASNTELDEMIATLCSPKRFELQLVST